MVSELLQKYIWLVELLVRAGDRGLTLDEIFERWEDRWDIPYNRRSFNNHREAIEEIFGVPVVCNRATNCYSIPSADALSDSDAAGAWLINTFTVNSLLTLSKERLSGRVAVEDVPSGHVWLTAIMSAMEDNNVVKIEYQKYRSSESSEYTIWPYAVKEADRRWYLVGYCVERGSIRVYGMDRIKSLEITPKNFALPKDFDVDDLFYNSYGTFLPDNGEKPQEVRLRASEQEAKYLRDLPLHPTQKEVAPGEFVLRVCPNEKLVMDLLARGPRIEVLSPASVRDQLRNEIIKLNILYE